MTDYNDLISFATQRELDYIEGINKHGGIRPACKAEGWTRSVVSDSLRRLKKRAAKQLPSQHNYTKIVPEGFAIKGVSQYIDKDGKVAGQWVKTSADAQAQQEMIIAAIGAMCEEIPRLEPVSAPIGTYGNLCNVYTLTDSHVGMRAWSKETLSGDWDLEIAEKVLIGCFEQMINSAPKAGTAIIAQLGDFMHWDSAAAAVTPTHGHNLDGDGRLNKVARIAVKVLRTIISRALERHDKVVVLLAEGNHDPGSSSWLRVMFGALYENEPRVEVIDSELPYYVYQHGNTMLGWHHGHLTKNTALPILFAAQFPQMWGNTTKRYVHTGHRHHTEIKEHSGVTVEQHPTLATRDAYAARGGWIAERQVTVITYSDKYGMVARNIVTPEMLEE